MKDFKARNKLVIPSGFYRGISDGVAGFWGYLWYVINRK